MWFLFDYILIIGAGLVLAYALLSALQDKRSAQSSLAWILFIIATPFLAIPIFFALGFRKESDRYPPLSFAPRPEAPASPHQAGHLLHKMGAPSAHGGNHLRLHLSPDEAREELDRLIACAQQRLDILIYILANDASGRRFVQQLTQKVRQGVDVRLNIDWLGSLFPPRKELRAFKAAGGELRYFSPLLHWRDKGQLNLRNHRKLLISDDLAVWAGGRNISDDYLASRPNEFVDLSYTATGPIVLSFAEIFDADWDVTGASAPPPLAQPAPCGAAELQVVPAGPDEPFDYLYNGILSLIHRANHRVWIATPYFVPTDTLAQALALAANRGVDVRILLPEKSDQIITDLARGPYLRLLQKAGCRVLRFMPGMLHAKAYVIDDCASVGSANFDTRSMHLNFEVNLFIYSSPEIMAVENWFASLAPHCQEGVTTPNRGRRLLESLFRLGAPIL